jgi:hypothetical protein
MRFVCGILFCILSSYVKAQVSFQSVEIRQSTFDFAAPQILTSDFSGRSTGDVFMTKASVENIETPSFEMFIQNSSGTMLRTPINPGNPELTGPVQGPLFLTGTSVSVPAQQTPAAVVQIEKISLDSDGRLNDVVTLNSDGRLVAYRNKGQSTYLSGFDDLDASSDSFVVFEFLDTNNGLGITSHTFFTVLATGDFDHNGCADIAAGGFGLSNIGTVGLNVTHQPLDLFVFWCQQSPGVFAANPELFSLGGFDPIDIEWVPPVGIASPSNRGTLYILTKEQCSTTNPVGSAAIYSFKFGSGGSGGVVSGVPQLVPPAAQTAPVSLPGRVTSLAVGDFDGDSLSDFMVSGNSSNCFTSLTSQVAGWVEFLPGQVTTLPATLGFPSQSLIRPNSALSWLQTPSPLAGVSSDVQGLQVADFDGNGQLDVGGLVAYGSDPTTNPMNAPADYIFWLGPLNSSTQPFVQSTNLFYPHLFRTWELTHPHYLSAPKATQIASFERNGISDVFVAGLEQLNPSWNVGALTSSFEVLKNNQPGLSSSGYIRDYGGAERAPQGVKPREIVVSLQGDRAVLGADLNLEVGGLSSGQHVAFFFDNSPFSFPVATPTVAGGTKSLMLHAYPQVTSHTSIVPSTQTWSGSYHSHFVRTPFPIPLNSNLLGYQANLQAVLFDPVVGAYFGSQGIELQVGN